MSEKKERNLNEELAKYLLENKHNRVWQNIRNWSGYSFILKADSYHFNQNEWIGLKDLFYDN